MTAAYSGWAAGQIDLKPEPATDGVYDQWQIAITGDVENPMTLSLSEMMELVPMDTDIATLHCGINPIGGGLIGNYEIKGISVKKLPEHAGVKDSATLLQVFDKEGYEYVIGLDTIAEKGCYLVLEVGGEPISYAQGYPVQFWPGGEAAWKATKEVTELRVLSVPVDSDEYAERNFPTGFPENKPCVAIFHLAEGQIIPADQPYTFEGFAHAWENQITGIEVSFDQGQTWARCETPDASVERWVYWNFTWTPPQAGAYTITVRAVMEGDVVSPATVEYLVNAE